jgi:hypothetical protein
MVRDLLMVNGIEVVANDAYDTIVEGGGAGDVWIVNDEDEPRVLEVLTDFDPDGSEHPKEAPTAWPWRCRQCGEEVEQQFQACWHCGAERSD